MKKTLLTIALMAVSASSIAAPLASWGDDLPTDGDTDVSTASISWVSELPTILSGEWVTFTGEGGAPLKDGTFSIEANGSFNTDEPVALEVHYYNSTTGETGDLISVGEDLGKGNGINAVNYIIGDVSFTSEKGADVSDVKAIIKQGSDLSTATIVEPNVKYAYSDLSLTDADAGKTNWNITSGHADVFDTRIPGDVITASALVTVDLEFAAL